MNRLISTLLFGIMIGTVICVFDYLADGYLKQSKIVGNLVGGLVGAGLYELFFNRKKNQSP